MELEERIARLEAIEAIRALKYRYFQACDRKQPDIVRECFCTGKVILDYGRVGSFDNREDMLAVFTELACAGHIVEMHHGQNPQIEILDADNARATWGLYYHMIDTRRELVTQLAGFYDDVYRREEGQWRIAGSRYEVTSTQIFELTEGLAKAIFAGSAAPAALDDPSQQAG